MSRSDSLSQETFACVRCGAAVPVAATECPACGLEVYPVEGVTQGETRCRACGGDMAIDDRVCPHCGAEVTVRKADDDFYCSECGGKVAEDDRVCPHCGAELEDDEEEEPAATDEDDGYVCSVCGGDVAVDDKICPHCGADVAEIEETPADPAGEESPEFSLTIRELSFLNEAERLQQDWASSIRPGKGERLILPAHEPKVGDITIQFFQTGMIVSVGNHTQGRYTVVSDAVDFVGDVVSDQVIFHFVEGRVEAIRAEEVDDAAAKRGGYYVWSGPLRDQRSGIEWYRPT